MNIYEIIYAIKEAIKEYTDDTKYTDDYLVYLVRLKRGFFLRREYNVAQRIVDQEISQTICMPLNLVEDTECPECWFDTDDCEVVRTIDPLPNTLELTNKNLILRVAPIGVMKRKFDLVSREKAVYAGEGNYEKNTIFAFYHSNGHIYLKSKTDFYKSMDAISVTAVFDNPMDAEKFKCGGDTACWDSTIDSYPIKEWMTDLIIKEIIRDIILTKSIPEDETNNANDDT